jgi:hypothetical protein
MNKQIADRLFALILTVFSVWYLWQALLLNSTARRMPVMVVTFTLICLAFYFIGEMRPPKKAVKKARLEDEPHEEDEPLEEEKDELNWYDVRVWGWMPLLFACIMVAGLAVGIGILTFLFYVFAAKGKWLTGIIFAVIQAGFLYIVFEVGFKTQLYQGIIVEMLQK